MVKVCARVPFDVHVSVQTHVLVCMCVCVPGYCLLLLPVAIADLSCLHVRRPALLPVQKGAAVLVCSAHG
jgi:hypothetical protein